MKLPDFGTPWISSRPTYGYAQDKLVAEAMLRQACLGAQIVGMKWDGFPNITKLHIQDNVYVSAKKLPQYVLYEKHRPLGQCWLMIEDKWAVLEEAPPADAEYEQTTADALPEMRTDQDIAKLATVHGDPIVEVRLGITFGHLIVQFDSGRCLFIQGNHELFESWEIRITPPKELRDPNSQWFLVNTPGGDVCMWTPGAFDPNFDAEWRRPQA